MARKSKKHGPVRWTDAARSKADKTGRALGPDHTYSTPPTFCLPCGYFMDHASAVTGKGEPTPGDITICINCGAVHTFTDSLRLAPTTLDAARDLLAPDKFNKLVLAQLFIKQRGPIQKKGKPS